MSVDLRGFEYALEPLRSQRQWQLDALHAQLGKTQGSILEAHEALAGLRSKLQVQSQEAMRSLHRQRIDPDRHTRGLRWLAQLQAEISTGESRLAELQSLRSRLSAQCLTLQYKLNVIEAHRDECMAEFACHESGRLAAEADRDWLVRLSVDRLLRKRSEMMPTETQS
jgi:hypothetical protein